VSTKSKAYLRKKRHELGENERQQIRDKIQRGDADVYRLAAEFHCMPVQVAGIKAALSKQGGLRGAAGGVDKVRALTVKQPMAHAILHLGKDVENRSRRTHYRGPLLIHASAHRERNPREVLAPYLDPLPSDQSLRNLPTRCIVGVVNVVDCVRNSKSKWATRGEWHWVLEKPSIVEPIECTGRLGLWIPPAKVLKKVTSCLEARMNA
jgi:hypothetical protein